MKKIVIHLLILVAFFGGCGKTDEQYPDTIKVRIQNLSPVQAIACRVTNECWDVIFPGNTTSFKAPPLENCLLIAYAEVDDPGSFYYAKYYSCWDEAAPNSSAEVKSFIFSTRYKEKCTENLLLGTDCDGGPTVFIIAEEIDGNDLAKQTSVENTTGPNGIRTINFRVDDVKYP